MKKQRCWKKLCREELRSHAGYHGRKRRRFRIGPSYTADSSRDVDNLTISGWSLYLQYTSVVQKDQRVQSCGHRVWTGNSFEKGQRLLDSGGRVPGIRQASRIGLSRLAVVNRGQFHSCDQRPFHVGFGGVPLQDNLGGEVFHGDGIGRPIVVPVVLIYPVFSEDNAVGNGSGDRGVCLGTDRGAAGCLEAKVLGELSFDCR